MIPSAKHLTYSFSKFGTRNAYLMIFSHWLVITWLFSFPTRWSFPTLISIFILLSIVMKYETSLVMWLLLPLSTNHVSSSTVDDVSSSTALNKMWPSSSESFYVSSLLRSALSVFLSLQFFARCPGLLHTKHFLSLFTIFFEEAPWLFVFFDQHSLSLWLFCSQTPHHLSVFLWCLSSLLFLSFKISFSP